MIFRGRSPIKAMIGDQYNCIVELIGIYPNLLDEWRKKECEQRRIIAKEYSEGDRIVENDTYNNLTIGFENLSTVETFFNNSMFLTVFSYFEGFINTIAKKEKY
ncbi:MAG: hypothetical protein R3Y59_09755 [bacterium]